MARLECEASCPPLMSKLAKIFHINAAEIHCFIRRLSSVSNLILGLANTVPFNYIIINNCAISLAILQTAVCSKEAPTDNLSLPLL